LLAGTNGGQAHFLAGGALYMVGNPLQPITLLGRALAGTVVGFG